jgi:hypothetical protein
LYLCALGRLTMRTLQKVWRTCSAPGARGFPTTRPASMILSGQVVLQQAVEIHKKATGTDPASIDPISRLGTHLHAQMDAIVEATDANQATINAKGVGFKAFIPAVFALLVNESFESHAKNEAQSR